MDLKIDFIVQEDFKMLWSPFSFFSILPLLSSMSLYTEYYDEYQGLLTLHEQISKLFFWFFYRGVSIYTKLDDSTAVFNKIFEYLSRLGKLYTFF